MFFDVSWRERVVALKLRVRNRGKRFSWVERPAISPLMFAVCQAAADDLAEIVGADSSLCGRALDASQILSEGMFAPMATALENNSVEHLKGAFRDILERDWAWADLDGAWRLRCRDILVGLYVCVAILHIHRPRVTAGTVIAA
ncbi:hypothetical protein MKK50_15060 [Methylobacterium sp. J-043]|nr:hypothetical protein [Methylobacterium sp. J-043]